MATQFSGGTYVNTTFTGAVRSDIQENLRAQLVTAGWSNVAQASGQGPGKVATFTVTIASPGVITLTGHGFLGNERVILQTSGALPTGLSVNTVYFVKYVDANTFKLATTAGGADINTSGSQSGTHTLNTESMLLESATHANVTNAIRVRLKDNRGNCIQISIENPSGTRAGDNATSSSSAGNLLPAAAKTFRVIATKYQFMCFTAPTSAAREFVHAGLLYVPSFLGTISDAGFMFSNSTSDTSTSICSSIRSSTTLGALSPACQVIFNDSLFVNASGTGMGAQLGFPELIVLNPASTTGFNKSAHYRWHNDAILTGDVLLSVGLSALADEAKLRGQFFDLVYIPDNVTGDTTDTWASHNWFNITQGNAGSGTVARGGVWMATS